LLKNWLQEQRGTNGRLKNCVAKYNTIVKLTTEMQWRHVRPKSLKLLSCDVVLRQPRINFASAVWTLLRKLAFSSEQ